MRTLMALVLVCTGFLATASLADDRDFELINATGYTIKGVYLDTTSSRVWGYENEIDEPFKDGETLSVKFGRGDKGCLWDMRIVWADGSKDDVWTGFNLCEISTITLKYDRNADKTWAITR